MHSKNELILDRVAFNPRSLIRKYAAQTHVFIHGDAQIGPLRRLGVKVNAYEAILLNLLLKTPGVINV